MHIDQAAPSGNKNSHHQEASRPDTPRASDEMARPTPPALAADVPAGQGTLPQCERCAVTFTPRLGGKPQRFCSPDCRRAFHDKPQRDNVHVASRGLPAVVDAPEPKQSADAPEAYKDFDWSSDDSVVLHHQPAVAAYINQAGGLTIRQERSWDQDEDIIIAIAPENVGEFIDKLTDVIGIPSFGK